MGKCSQRYATAGLISLLEARLQDCVNLLSGLPMWQWLQQQRRTLGLSKSGEEGDHWIDPVACGMSPRGAKVTWDTKDHMELRSPQGCSPCSALSIPLMTPHLPCPKHWKSRSHARILPNSNYHLLSACCVPGTVLWYNHPGSKSQIPTCSSCDPSERWLSWLLNGACKAASAELRTQQALTKC